MKLELQAIHRRLGTAEKQARLLRFKEEVRNVECDAPCGLNMGALLGRWAEDLPGLRDRALLSAEYDAGLRASAPEAVFRRVNVRRCKAQQSMGEPARLPQAPMFESAGNAGVWNSISPGFEYFSGQQGGICITDLMPAWHGEIPVQAQSFGKAWVVTAQALGIAGIVKTMDV